MIHDPIVDEVREARRKLLAQFGGDLQKLMDWLQAREAEHPERVVTPQQLRERLQSRPREQAQ